MDENPKAQEVYRALGQGARNMTRAFEQLSAVTQRANEAMAAMSAAIAETRRRLLEKRFGPDA